MRPLRPVTVAFCLQPPLLLPVVAGAHSAELGVLRAAVRAAVQVVLHEGPEVVVVLGTGADGVRFGPGDAGDLRGFGVDLDLTRTVVADDGRTLHVVAGDDCVGLFERTGVGALWSPGELRAGAAGGA